MPKRARGAASPLAQTLFNLLGTVSIQTYRCPLDHVTTKPSSSLVLDLVWWGSRGGSQ